MKITLTNGARPAWLKDNDLVLARYYCYTPSKPVGHPAVADTTKLNLFGWGDTDLLAIEIADTHPYALATSKGFTYWSGTDADAGPEDWDGGEVLLRKGYPILISRPDWSDEGCDWDIIGYHKKPEPILKDFTIHTNVKFTVKADTDLNATLMAKDLLEASDLIGDWGGIIAKPTTHTRTDFLASTGKKVRVTYENDNPVKVELAS